MRKLHPARPGDTAPASADDLSGSGSPLGLHRVTGPEHDAGVLPQAAWRLDASPEIAPDEVRIRVQRLNLDAASYRQLSREHGGDGDAIRAAVREIIASRGKMHNPVTGSGGMLTGVVEAVGPRSPLGLRPGDRVATLVSLTLTPLTVYDGLARWDGLSEQVPCDGHAILFARSIAAVLADDLPVPLSLAVLDVCGAPALTWRVVRGRSAPVVAVLGASGKSGSLSAAAAREAGASRIIGVVPDETEAALLRDAGPLADAVVIADARQPVAVAEAVAAAGGPADVTVVCVDVPGCEGGAILATAAGGTVVFFSMATSFSAAALGAEGLAADVTMLIGNGYVPGHAELALGLVRANPFVRSLFERRIEADSTSAETPVPSTTPRFHDTPAENSIVETTVSDTTRRFHDHEIADAGGGEGGMAGDVGERGERTAGPAREGAGRGGTAGAEGKAKGEGR